MFGADLTYSLYLDNGLQQQNLQSRDLPAYLVPTFRNRHPWNRLSTYANLESDFILIAEFSELEGPRPVICIPTEGAADFNVTDFTVRIMSLDHQTPTSHGFHLIEDSQVLISEIRDNVFAFVHHFALYDRHARGFVRPFAISYVTLDHRKLMHFFEEISQQLKKVTRYLKYGNRLMFKNDLESYILDLQYTKAQMLLRHRKSTVAGPVDSDDIIFKNLKTLESNLAETVEILKIIKPTLTDKRVEQRFCRLEEKAKIEQKRPKSDSISLNEFDNQETQTPPLQTGSLGTVADVEDTLFPDNKYYKPRIIKISSGRKFDIHLRGLHELCSWGAKEGLQKLRHMYRYFKRDMAVLQSEKIDESLTDPAPGLLTFGTDCIAANVMTNIDRNCVGGYCYSRRSDFPGFNLGRWSSNDTLESFKSIASSYKSIEDDSDSMMSANSHLGSPRPSSLDLKNLDMLGNDDSLKEIYSLGILSHERLRCLLQTVGFTNDYSPQSDNKTKECGSEDNSFNSKKSENEIGIQINSMRIDDNENKSKEIGDDSSVKHNVNSDRVDNTFLSYTRNSGGESGITEQLFFVRDYFPQDDSMKVRSHSNSESDSICSSINILSNGNSQATNCVCENSFQKKEPAYNTKIDDSKVHGVKVHVSDRGQEVSVKTSSSEGDESSSTPISSFSQSLHREMSISEMTDRSTPTSMMNYDTADDSNEVVTSGPGLLKLMNMCGCVQHVMYSILIGRTVCVIGSDRSKDETREVVKALKVFVPGIHSNSDCCISWTSKVPHLADLNRIKLVGICRPERKPLDRLIPKAVKRLVTIVDLEKKTIQSPVYQGYFISLLTSKRKHFKSEDAFHHLVKAILVEISAKVFLYYHCFCLGSVGTSCSGFTVRRQSQFIQDLSSKFLRKIGVHDCDQNIIEYLVEVIKYEHITDYYQSRRHPDVPVKPITYQNLSCQTANFEKK